MHQAARRLTKAVPFAAILGASMLSSTAAFGQQAVAEVEPNNARTQAQVVQAGLDTIVNGTIASTADNDYYKVNSVPVGECVTFILQPNPSANYDLTLTNSAGKVLATSTHGVGQMDLVQTCNISGAVYVNVRYVSGPTGASGTYTLEATY